jgi:hypothetical protein
MMRDMDAQPQKPTGSLKVGLLITAVVVLSYASLAVFEYLGTKWGPWYAAKWGSGAAAVRDAIVSAGVDPGIAAIAVLVVWRLMLFAAALAMLVKLLRSASIRTRALAAAGILGTFIIAADAAAVGLLTGGGVELGRAEGTAQALANVLGVWAPMAVALGYVLYSSLRQRHEEQEQAGEPPAAD